MNKILLTAINAKYIHTNLAIRYLQKFASKYEDIIDTVEYTINQNVDFIIQEIHKKNPDLLLFSCYIWNIELIKIIIRDYKKIAPDTKIVLGGPEVSYDAQSLMEQFPEIDFVIIGEGEVTFLELMEGLIDKERDISNINGIVCRIKGQIRQNKQREALNMDDVPFVYEKGFKEFENRIIYYETTRGCPFNCQYCLSSIEKGVRFRSLNLVFNELQLFLDEKVMQVKFVDRTFNCKKSHAMAIWQYLHEHDNGYTNFHFEISADLLDEETIEFLKVVRPGLFQFEIGIQSTNDITISHIQRKTDFNKLANVVKRINKLNNIHQHLDLIVGLPGEDYTSFKASFNDVYALEPDQLQIGFLKILKGSGMEQKKKEFGIIYREKAPYEVLQTNDLSYEEIIKLKMIEEMVEIYFNSHNFRYTIKYIEQFFDHPFNLYEALALYWEKNSYHTFNHNKTKLYTILLEFYTETVNKDDNSIKNILKFDMYLQEKVKKFPDWFEQDETFKTEIRNFYKNEENIVKYLPQLKEYTSKQISRMVHIEVFPIDIISWIKGTSTSLERRNTAVLFNYYNKDIIKNSAKFYEIELIYNISQEK